MVKNIAHGDALNRVANIEVFLCVFIIRLFILVGLVYSSLHIGVLSHTSIYFKNYGILDFGFIAIVRVGEHHWLIGNQLRNYRFIRNKMGESNVSTLTLEPSVSFGKFENDSLSWEKWSSFSPNKYLEEVEKCSTPGSVAEKKAYFEAHYKNIAARKAELEEDNLGQCAPARSELKHESHIEDTNENVSHQIGVDGDAKFSVETEHISQQKAYLEELYKKIADRMGEQEEQDTPVQHASSILDELKHKDYIGNTMSCDEKVNTCGAEKTNEEVDSVAQKKAYFEGQVKEIDGQRAEGSEQDKPLSSGYPKFDEVQKKHHTVSRHASECTENAHNDKKITNQLEQEEVIRIEAEDTIVYDVEEKQEICAGECSSTSSEVAKEDLIISQQVHTGSSDSGMEFVITKEPSDLVNCPNPVKKMDNVAKTIPENGAKKLKAKDRIMTVKKVSAEKEQPLTRTKKKVVSSAAKSILVSSRSPKQAPSSHLMAASKAQPLSGTNKKLVSPTAKSSPISTPKSSKLVPASPSMSASKLSGKKLNTTYIPRNKNTTLVVENKRAGPTSLHMSINLGSPNLSVDQFEPASGRKSLIMEQMADKDIIRRAFSAFKNNFQELRSSHDEKIRVTKASKVPERELTTPPRKHNERLGKTTDKRTPTRGQLGNFSSVAPGAVSHEENKRGKAFSPSVASEKRKDKVGQESISKELEKVQIRTRSKVKDGDVTMVKKISKALELPRSKG